MARRKYFVLGKRNVESQEQGRTFWRKAEAVSFQSDQIKSGDFSAHVYEMRWGAKGEWRPPIKIDQAHYEEPIVEGSYEDPPE